jgi:hypothetical protein
MGSWQEAIRTLGSEGWARALTKLPGTGARKDKEFEDWWAKEVGRSPTYGLEQYSLFLEKLDGREFMKDIHTPTLILAPMHSTAAPVPYPSCVKAWLISGIKNQWQSRSRGPRLCSLMAWVMRFTSIERRSVTRNSMPSSTVSIKNRLVIEICHFAMILSRPDLSFIPKQFVSFIPRLFLFRPSSKSRIIHPRPFMNVSWKRTRNLHHPILLDMRFPHKTPGTTPIRNFQVSW